MARWECLGFHLTLVLTNVALDSHNILSTSHGVEVHGDHFHGPVFAQNGVDGDSRSGQGE